MPCPYMYFSVIGFENFNWDQTEDSRLHLSETGFRLSPE